MSQTQNARKHMAKTEPLPSPLTDTFYVVDRFTPFQNGRVTAFLFLPKPQLTPFYPAILKNDVDSGIGKELRRR